MSTFAKADLSSRGPYATKEDSQISRQLGISVRELRSQRAAEDLRGRKALLRRTKRELIQMIAGHLAAAGFAAIPLCTRFEYSYFDDGEVNDGDIGWIVLEDGKAFGLDEDMQIRLEHFSKNDLADIMASMIYAQGRNEPLDSEHDAP